MFIQKNLPNELKSSMVDKGIWSLSCPIPLERLKVIQVYYYDFNYNKKDGEIVVLDIASQYVINIFKELFSIKFPIFTISPINEFDGDDQASMEANNSSGFNYRKILGESSLSIHSYGLAIDINPKQNPYIKDGKIMPTTSEEYISRSNYKKGMISLEIASIFAKNGFSIWGGNWNKSYKDYHHFQLPENVVQILAKINITSGEILFKCCVYKQEIIKNIKEEDIESIISLYNHSESKFISTCQNILSGKIIFFY